MLFTVHTYFVYIQGLNKSIYQCEQTPYIHHVNNGKCIVWSTYTAHSCWSLDNKVMTRACLRGACVDNDAASLAIWRRHMAKNIPQAMHQTFNYKKKKLKTYPRAISKLLMSFLIFHISTLRSADDSSDILNRFYF